MSDEGYEKPIKGRKGKNRGNLVKGLRKGFTAKDKYYGRLASSNYRNKCVSNHREAVVKVASNPPRGRNVWFALNYIARVDLNAEKKLEEIERNEDGKRIAVHPWGDTDRYRERREAFGIRAMSDLQCRTLANDGQRPTVAGILSVSARLRRSTIGEVRREPGRLELYTNDGLVLKKQNEINNLYYKWAKDFEKVDNKKKYKPVHVKHLILSATCDKSDKNLAKVYAASLAALQKKFPHNEYVFGLHQDGKKPHVHVIIKAAYEIENEKGIIDRRKIRIQKEDIHELRTIFANELTKLGLDHVATLRRDRPNELKAIENGEKVVKKQEWFAHALSEVRNNVEQLEKKKLDLQKAISKGEASPELKKKRDVILEAIAKTKEHIKQNTVPNSKKRLDSFALLRRFERDIKKTVKGFEKNIKNVAVELESLDSGQGKKFFENVKISAGASEKESSSKLDRFKNKNSKELNDMTTKLVRECVAARNLINKIEDRSLRHKQMKGLDDYIKVIEKSSNTFRNAWKQHEREISK